MSAKVNTNMRDRYTSYPLAASGIDAHAIEQWLQSAGLHKLSLFQYLCQQQVLAESALCQAYQDYFAWPIADIFSVKENEIDIAIGKSLYQKKIGAVVLNDGTIYIADAFELHRETIYKLWLKRPIQFVFCEASSLKRFCHQLFNTDNYTAEKINSNGDLIEQLLIDAIQSDASDIHFEPIKTGLRVRMRINGVLQVITTLSSEQQQTVISRLKLLSHCDLAEKRKPQDGRFQFQHAEAPNRDCRLSCLPTQFGEKIVVRLLSSTQQVLSLQQLGMTPKQQALFSGAINQPQGLVLVTGPTGSGKTNTLYTALAQLNAPTKNISTIEDPIEITLPGINQVNVNAYANLDFACALRSFLRQDPDIIMVGEIRDKETADIAIKAAQTGHLVLSTLHTNGAPETLTRLLNMGIALHNLTDSLTLIIAQRLVRVLCKHCKQAETNKQWGIIYKPTGCNRCRQGYSGRTGLFEFLACDNNTWQQVQADATDSIRQRLQQTNMQSFHVHAQTLLQMGITSLSEVESYL